MEISQKDQELSPGQEIPGWIRVLFGFPLAALGGFVTALVVLFLFMYVASRIGGGPRAPGLIGGCFFWLLFGGVPLAIGTWLLRNTSKPPVSRKVILSVLLCFLVLGADVLCGPKNWRGVFRRERTVRGDAANLNGTFITAHLDAEIRPGTNLLWCGTFQLAWNEACSLAGGDLRLVNFQADSLIQSPIAAALNQHSFTKDCIDEASYVAMSGLVSDKTREKIVNAVKNKLGFDPRLLPEKGLTPRPHDFVAYACLWKKLSFPMPFERLDDSFRFANKQVRAFGLGKTKASHEAMCPQVLVLDYQNEDDFVIELKTTAAGDRLILAKVQPKGTLGEMAATIRARSLKRPGQPAGTNDVLIVPRVSLDIIRHFSEIENHWLVPVGRNVAPDLFLQSAMQSTKFEMNEKGVELLSEAHMAFACAQEREPVRPHIMVFDKPFLVTLERNDARMPFFVLWVDNPELLVPR